MMPNVNAESDCRDLFKSGKTAMSTAFGFEAARKDTGLVISEDDVEEDVKRLFKSGSVISADFGFQGLPSYRKDEPPDLEDGIGKKVDDYLERMPKDGPIKTDIFDEWSSFNGPSMFKSLRKKRNILRPVRNQQDSKSRFAVSEREQMNDEIIDVVETEECEEEKRWIEENKKESIHQPVVVKPEAPQIPFVVRACEEMENLIAALNAEENIDVENHREGSGTVSASPSTTSECVTKNTPRPVTPKLVDSAVSPGHLKPASRHEEPQTFCGQMTSLGHGAVEDANKEKNHFVGEEKREFVPVPMNLLTDLEAALMELELSRFAANSVETKTDVENFQQVVKAIKTAPVVIGRLFGNEQMAPLIKALYPGVYAEAQKFMEENKKTS